MMSDRTIDTARLREALAVLETHHGLLSDALRDLCPPGSERREAVLWTECAIDHVLDGFRSSETRGG